MAKFDEMPDFRASLPRQTHDLSHKFGLTATVAHLMPVFHDFLNAGETIDLGVSFNLRTQPLQSAAMVDISSHVEYFFVPMFLLYEPFGSMYYNINDQFSSFYTLNNNKVVQTKFPVWNWSELYNTLVTSRSQSAYYGAQTIGTSSYRLFDLLGFNVHNWMKQEDGTWNPNVFPYQLLAYHCIYQYYYRLDTREEFDSRTFNWDRYYNTDVVSLTSEEVGKLCSLRNRPKDDDYFTNVKVSPIVDVLNLNFKDSLDVAKNWLSRANLVTSVDGGNVLTSGNAGSSDSSPFMGEGPDSSIQTQFGFHTLYQTDTNFINGTDVGTANIRAMFATEKLWSITGRAKKHYDDQTLAHFGFKVPHDPKHEISVFGHDRGEIHIGEVISTSGTETTPLGEIAGKGYGTLNARSHRFTAPCHGVVMAIMSFVPKVTYGNTFGKYNVMTSREDLYTPEYDHLGMQPLFGYEIDPNDSSQRNTIIGWQYRYEQWKRRFNRVTSAFTSAGNLDSWMLDFSAPGGENNANQNSFYLNYMHLPNELNQIMLVNYVTNIPEGADGYTYDSNVYNGDPFVVDAFIKCKKVSTMSDYSLPRLDA